MSVATSTSRQVALNATTATGLCGTNNDVNPGVPRTLWFWCAADIYIGFASNITSGTGAKLLANTPISVALAPGQIVYAIAGSATPTAYVLDQVS